METVLLHKSAFLCVTPFFRLSSFGSANALLTGVTKTFASFYTSFPDILRNFGVIQEKDMLEEQMNSYRLTSIEEPGDERMAQIMREVAEDARESTRRAAERVAAGIEAAAQDARARVEETVSRLRNGNE